MSDEAFWDKIAAKYAKRSIDDEAAYVATLERVRHWLTPGMTVLELGCGTGTTALKLADAAGRIVGTDASGEMIRIAQGKAAGVERVSFVQARAEEAGSEETGAGARFDAVMCFNLLHLVGDRGAVLGHVRGLLETGALFISKTPCLKGKPWFRPLLFVLRCVGKAPPSVGFVSPDSLRAEIVAAGFEIVETGDYPKGLPNHFVVARAV